MSFKDKISDLLFGIITDISPSLNVRLKYWRFYGKKINLKNPTTFIEKLLWLKLYNYSKNDLVKKCSDKFLVRDYVTSCGLENTLIPLIDSFDDPNQINFDALPNQFVLKWNFGCGFNIVCKNKKELDFKKTINQLKKWQKTNYYRPNAELQYKNVEKKLLCEKFITNGVDSVIPDYKIYCFHGEPKAILVIHDRGNNIKAEFFDTEWKRLESPKKYNSVLKPTEAPKQLKTLLEMSRVLSKPFPFVRCDYYIVDNKIYFGELTFTPAGGMYASETAINGKEMGELLDITR